MYSKNKPRKGSMDSSIWSTPPGLKEICKCCRKDLGLISGNIALFRGKCISCRQKICTDCVASSLCHKCRVKRYITLNPKDLMKLPSKRLIEISSTLHFHNPQGYEKSELVQLILAIYGCKWKRPIPQEPGNMPEPVQINGKCVLCEAEPTYRHLIFCHKCASMLQQPEFLMSLPGRQLHCILKLLQIPEQEMKVREKGELVTLVLNRIGTDSCWKPPLPQQPSTSNPQHIDTILLSRDSSLESETKDEVRESDQSLESERAVSIVTSGDNERPETAHGDNSALQTETNNEEQGISSNASIEHVSDITDISVIQQLRGHQLKAVLRSLGEEPEGIFERNDLLERVTELWTIWINQNGREEVANNSHVSLGDNEADVGVSGRPEIALASEVPQLKSLENEDAIKALTVRQLKMILQKYSVNYAGCRERVELADKVVNLWKDKLKWNAIGESLPDDDTCKICMDAPIDCVLLECGHMVACTECGRQMSECPICRQFVIRVVHTFRV